MLDKDKVFTLFRVFSGYDDAAAYNLRGICDFAADRLAGSLREDVNPADSPEAMERLCTAAAVDALCNCMLLQMAADGHDEVKVGDVSLRRANARLEGEMTELRDRFMADVADLLAAPKVLEQVSL